MAFVYLGDDAVVKKEFAELGAELDARYREVLGTDRYNALEDVNRRVLEPASFYSDAEKMKKDLGGFGSGSNSFAIGTTKDLNIGNDGRLQERKVDTAPAFYVSEAAFHMSGSSHFTDRRIASYVHEFDHYSWYALQRIPAYLLTLTMGANIPRDGNQPDFDRLMGDLLDDSKPKHQAFGRLCLGLYFVVLNQQYESANHILDNMILEKLGIKNDMPWRGTPRTYQVLSIPTIATMMIPAAGDPFANLDDKDVVDRFIEWDRSVNFGVKTDYFTNFTESIKNLKISRIPFSTMLARARRKSESGRNKGL